MKTLVLTEKPSVAREIARVLGCKINKNGGIFGDKYIVTWALGHLVTLAMPEELNKEWKNWNEETLPMIPDKFLTKVISSTSKQFNAVKTFMKSDEVGEIIIATDAGREGELVARWIIDKVGVKKPLKRLWISSMTDTAIKEGFRNLKDAKNYYPLYLAAVARAEADWLVGLNVTRALTCKYNASLSAGRVQTPTLSLIVEREQEIKKFVSKTYYTIILKVGSTEFVLLNKQNNPYHLDQKEEALVLISKIKQKKLVVQDLKEVKKHDVPPLLYDLTSLQQDANKLYGFSAKHTLDLVQNLYEHHKYLTYPRTDSKYLSTDMLTSINERLRNCCYGEYNKYLNIALKNITMNKRIFDNSKVSDHHAIIPTELKPNINSLSIDEKKIYDLVLKRFVGAFMPNNEYLVTTVIIGDNEYKFKASGSRIIVDGWKEIYKNSDLIEKANSMPLLKLNDLINSNNLCYKEGKTLPPERFTEATLLYAMEHAGKYTDDTQEKEALQMSSGIGTPATRAEIIERIFSAGYVKLNERSIYPTEKGNQLIMLAPPELKSVSLTAKQELNLNLISKGKLDKNKFIKEICQFTKELTNSVLDSKNKYKHDNATTSKCPNCHKILLDVTNKFGKSLVCIDKECGYKKHVYKISKLKCPNCHHQLKQIGEDENAYFKCDCGFKEKTKRFFDKLKDNKNNMRSADVRKILKNQEKEIPVNNPFADLFKK